MHSPVEDERPAPCTPSPCGANAVCRVSGNAGTCSCLPDYIGNPYEGCRPECVVNSDCPVNLACVRSKCRDPCPGACGQNAVCNAVNHVPMCSCIQGYSGDPFRYCSLSPVNRKKSTPMSELKKIDEPGRSGL